jgi:hypothetical protein
MKKEQKQQGRKKISSVQTLPAACRLADSANA